MGVELATAAGHIQVDKYQNTAATGVYALGDVCGQVELTPMAIAAGRRLADRYVCIYVCIYVYMYIYVFIYVFIYVCANVCTFVS